MMFKQTSPLRPIVLTVFSAALGLIIAWMDVVALWKDDTAQGILAMLLVFSGVSGIIEPTRPWRWALAMGVWLSLVHLTLRLAGRADSIEPDTFATIFLLLPIGLIACGIGAYAGSLLRRTLKSAI